MNAAPAAPALRLVVVRHGQTAWNAAGRFQGQADPPLDGAGRAQAEATAAALDAAGWLGPRALVVSSDLRRARSSAAPIAARAGGTVRVDARLREVALGGWEGLDRDAAALHYPEEYFRWIRGEDVRRGGGESEAEAGARAVEAIADACSLVGPGDPLIVVAHGLVLRAAVGLLAAQGWCRLAHVDIPHLGNGEWMELVGGVPVGRGQLGW